MCLADPEVLEAASISVLYGMKQYQKLQQKLDKELEVMRKKHDKVSTMTLKLCKNNVRMSEVQRKNY